MSAAQTKTESFNIGDTIRARKDIRFSDGSRHPEGSTIIVDERTIVYYNENKHDYELVKRGITQEANNLAKLLSRPGDNVTAIAKTIHEELDDNEIKALLTFISDTAVGKTVNRLIQFYIFLNEPVT